MELLGAVKAIIILLINYQVVLVLLILLLLLLVQPQYSLMVKALVGLVMELLVALQ
jgi:hypothetical protein